ncbi:bcl-2-like protein 1 isoform X2 [Sorex araneus]|uniref:bcl-2-like protein 1 isoform X2 n=1 Tax=Sorex araneus TaxID=42254 RepID=UPI0024334C65|nr:bcl-2-like protein 1 isoform X2 [Sorex araneus]
MSRNNWELVVDILSYKLSQKGHSWSALNDVEGTTAEAPEGPESEMETPSTTVDNPAGHLLDSPAPPGARGHGCGVDAPEATPVDPVKQTLREVCDDFDRRFQQAFSDMTAQVHITPATARQTFEQDTFAELYGNNAAAGSRRVQERFQRWMLAGMTLAGMAVLGSLFFSRK